MSKVDLSVSIDDAHLDRFPEVVENIKDAGMNVEQQMGEIGVIAGSIDSEKIEQLHKVEDVSHVEESRQFQIAPPDSGI